MCPPLSRRKVLSFVTLVGTGSFAGCQGITLGRDPLDQDGTETSEPDDSLGLAYSESSGSFRRDENVHSGWVHIVGDGESADLTFDARFCRELGAVEPRLRQSVPGGYVLRFETGSEPGDGTSRRSSEVDSSCTSGTRIVGGANVPNDWETLVIEVNGVEIQTIERSGTMPTLRPLPDPVSGPGGRRSTSA